VIPGRKLPRSFFFQATVRPQSCQLPSLEDVCPVHPRARSHPEHRTYVLLGVRISRGCRSDQASRGCAPRLALRSSRASPHVHGWCEHASVSDCAWWRLSSARRRHGCLSGCVLSAPTPPVSRAGVPKAFQRRSGHRAGCRGPTRAVALGDSRAQLRLTQPLRAFPISIGRNAPRANSTFARRRTPLERLRNAHTFYCSGWPTRPGQSAACWR
jgi:hypothetical protein